MKSALIRNDFALTLQTLLPLQLYVSSDASLSTEMLLSLQIISSLHESTVSQEAYSLNLTFFFLAMLQVEGRERTRKVLSV